MPGAMMTVDGFQIPVSVTGPERSPNVVLLGAAHHAPAAYEVLCSRLHTASLRTVVIGADPRLHPKAVLAILDAVDVPWAVLVGDRFGAEVAWELAAVRPDRFTGLVVVDRGHPRVAGPNGAIADPDCAPVEVNTTVLVSGPAARAAAEASQRHVFGDFRLAEFAAGRNAADSTAQLAAEIVLRSNFW